MTGLVAFLGTMMAIILSLIVQVVAALVTIRLAGQTGDIQLTRLQSFERLSAAVFLLLGGIIVQVLIWAILFYLLGAADSAVNAVYVSGVTFTALGYGDVTLQPPYRLLAPLESAVGLLMFGLSTASLLAVIQRGSKAP